MNEKKTARRTRQPKRKVKHVTPERRELPREELPYTYETVYSYRYTLHVPSPSLANAPVLG
jgi:hypothetical protein